ncbi:MULTISPECIES: cation diffusion facilitator family transporter [Clostridium]|uniref:C-terminal region cation efflux system protein CZCD n=1 Tax=Clostridium acetobutylicum (strain ATCC 824 / DSM 792 / JCM 1419 / IAM 19013 / LMG 5710 / NBRC 13948 / NRRL B-527 / VKM B-1787 / 2291 / W) TaxID=272562 RepID=Q97LF5_CLOAB|nr:MULTISPECIES: cation diffusion facilitator family transporter [Clostridium]AAK78584.1 C-terminal region cation efflux system protein CZCD [Clostridium acetobutylicum ATCC 824]AEI31331.1 cation efflux system protein CZCD [Clostridium acetobutylicum DSM 1731]AWV80308.1 cation transporter [Clostridium acetobutylicum]MBC2392493.1 cation transporter [Clostridium acetobutylicum]MBC2583787.1 cation transporter [Clostridium acetobutylicum]
MFIHVGSDKVLVKFIVSKFIKDYSNISNKKVRENYGILSSIMGLIVNLILFVIELSIGIFINSIAVIADAFHNLADVSASVITLIGFKLSNKPADKEHPFGHGRVEYLSALLVSAIILLVGVEFIKTSFLRILSPEPVSFNLISFIIMLIAIPLKLWLSLFNKNIGKKINSSALKASGADALNDVYILSSVILSLLVSAFSTISIDGYVGVLIGALIIWSAVNLMKDTIDPLLGQAPDPNLVKSIKKMALKCDVILGVHDLIIHNYGPGRTMISFHAEVPYNIPIMTLHSKIDETEKRISEELDIFVVIHMDPLLIGSPEVSEAKRYVSKILKDFPSVQSFHDFRIVGDGEDKKLIFDIVVPFDVDISEKKLSKLGDDIKSEIIRRHPHYDCVITVDRDYSGI